LLDRRGFIDGGNDKRQSDAMNEGSSVKPLGFKDTGRCPCCGRVSRCVWGLVRHDCNAQGSYFVHWTLGHVFENGADFHIILRGRSAAVITPDRYGVSLKYRVLDNGPAFMLVDARPDVVARVGALADHCLKRSDVIGGPLAPIIFDICDAILAADGRLSSLWDAPDGSP
jgi:hypothetical protein